MHKSQKLINHVALVLDGSGSMQHLVNKAKVKPADNPDFDIFVQSKAINRNLIPGTKMLLMK